MNEGQRVIVKRPEKPFGEEGIYLHPDYFNPETRSVVRLDKAKHLEFSFPNEYITAISNISNNLGGCSYSFRNK